MQIKIYCREKDLRDNIFLGPLKVDTSTNYVLEIKESGIYKTRYRFQSKDNLRAHLSDFLSKNKVSFSLTKKLMVQI